MRYRLSFSCSPCDKRHTPASVRFLGRRIYVAATVVLASAVRAGLTEWRVNQLTEWIRVPRQTLERWRVWWQQAFVDTVFFGTARGQFMPPLETATLPASLLRRFDGADPSSRLVAVLRFLAPLSQAHDVTTLAGTSEGLQPRLAAPALPQGSLSKKR